MINNLRERFLNYINENNLIKKGEGVVVGLSGGPDSVCLLHLLYSVKDDLELKIAAAHINHMFRGEEADGDELYAKLLCEELGIEFCSLKMNVGEYGKEKGLSSETAGREIRYNFFNEVMKKFNFSKIATAHNANDQAETVLMRMMRGTGLEGLGGIPVKREDKYIRPILFMKREEVEEYCNVYSLNPRIDKTNLEKVYSRNKVRLDILPYMKENFNQDVVEVINRMALLLQEDNKYILKQVDEHYKKYCTKNCNKVIIDKEGFNCDGAIINRVLRKAIKEVSGNKYDVELKHIQDVKALSNMNTGKKINLPNNICAENVYGKIKIYIDKEVKSEVKRIEFDRKEILESKISFGGYIFSFEVIDNNKKVKLNVNENIKYFNYDAINGKIIIRNRKDGDKICPLGMKGNKKLKDIFIDMKIPKEERALIPILQFDDEIAWIVGLKLSDRFKISDKTNKILKISIMREEN